MAMWHVLAGEAQLLRMVFSHLLEVLSLSLPYQEKAKGQGRTTRVETSVPKAVSVHCDCCLSIFILLVRVHTPPHCFGSVGVHLSLCTCYSHYIPYHYIHKSLRCYYPVHGTCMCKYSHALNMHLYMYMWESSLCRSSEGGGGGRYTNTRTADDSFCYPSPSAV